MDKWAAGQVSNVEGNLQTDQASESKTLPEMAKQTEPSETQMHGGEASKEVAQSFEQMRPHLGIESSSGALLDPSIATEDCIDAGSGDLRRDKSGESNPPGAPRKRSLARTFGATGLEDDHLPRKMLLLRSRLEGGASSTGTTLDTEAAMADLLQPDLYHHMSDDQIAPSEHQTLFGKRIASAPPPKITSLFRNAVATRAMSQGPSRGWRDIVQDVRHRKNDVEQVTRFESSVDPPAASKTESGLLPAFGDSRVGVTTLEPHTPTPPSRPSGISATPNGNAMTPRRLIDVENIFRGVVVAKQELSRIVANIQTAVHIVEEAEGAAQRSLEETATACSALKETVQAERDLVHSFRQERDEQASILEAAEAELQDCKEQLRVRTAELDEAKDQADFLETAVTKMYEQNQMTKSMWKDSMAKARSLEASTTDLKDKLDVHREEVARGQRREAILLEHKQALEAALLEASEENAALLDRIAQYEKQHGAPEKDVHQPTTSAQPNPHPDVELAPSLVASEEVQAATKSLKNPSNSNSNSEKGSSHASDKPIDKPSDVDLPTEKSGMTTDLNGPSASLPGKDEPDKLRLGRIGEETSQMGKQSVPGTWFD